jgi:hypothetical protein
MALVPPFFGRNLHHFITTKYLTHEKIICNTTVAKQLNTVKTFIGYARNQGVEVSDQYRNFKIKKENCHAQGMADNS